MVKRNVTSGASFQVALGGYLANLVRESVLVDLGALVRESNLVDQTALIDQIILVERATLMDTAE